jgi:multidrug efflux pump
MEKERSGKEIVREFKLSSFSIKNWISVMVLIGIIFFAGLFSYISMPKESFPEVVIPTIYVGTSYPGNSPVDIENLITRPIEKEIKKLKNVDKFTSTSIQGYSTIIVEFSFDEDVSKALSDVKDAVDKAKPELPNDNTLTDPDIFEIDFSDFPVMNVNLSGNFSKDELKKHAEYLQEEIEKLPEISAADIRGLLDKEVKIDVDMFKMQALKINFNDIESAIASENVSMSGGDILSISGNNRNRRTIRITGEFKDPNQLNDVIVKHEKQRIVFLSDIAKVSFGPIEPNSFARLNGDPVVTLDIKKKSGENLLNGVAGVKAILKKAKEAGDVPENLIFTITNDQSKFTKNILNNLENSIISGIILVTLVLLFFLGLRNALFVGIAIPMSMLLGIAILNYSGITLNMMVLFSLILALGMLVDNGIVVVENIYRLYSEGKDKETASRFGVGEVAMPIISSTATTLMAFVPLLFWKDMMGEFMKYMPLTLIIVLSSSLFVGLVVNPVLTSRFIKVEKQGVKSKAVRFWIRVFLLLFIGVLIFVFGDNIRWIGSLMIVFAILGLVQRFVFQPFSFFFQNKILVFFETLYANTVRFALRKWNPVFIFIGTILLLIFSFGFFGSNTPPITFMPDKNPNYVNVFIEMPLGTDIQSTDALTQKLESRIQKVIEPYRPLVEAVLSQVGEGTSDPNEGFSLGSSPHKARITVSFYEYAKRIELMDVSTSEIMEKIREAVQDVPEAKAISIGKDNMGPPAGPPINIEISGKDFGQLITLTEEIKGVLNNANVPGVDQLKSDLELNKPELLIHIDRDVARRYGVSTQSISLNLRTALFGKEISKYKEEEDDYPIQLRLKPEQRYNLTDLLSMKITFRDPSSGKIVQVPVSSLVTVENSTTYGSVKRKDMNRVITIFSNVKEGYNANEIVVQYKEILGNYHFPPGYDFKFTGEQEEQNKSTAFLMQAMVIAIFFIFLIIVSQFNSITGPIIILFSVIFSTIGVFLGFAILKMPISILMVGIGIISLAGIVVNNAIVLIDYIILTRERRKVELGLGKNDILPYDEVIKSIIKAGETRFRPVILTAITTVLGLIPLAIGFNISFFHLLQDLNPHYYIGGDSASFWGPMSWTIIFGLTFATFLTLVVVPVMYLLFDRFTLKLNNLAKKLS